jgi:NDMA-dependent alcohol dehydrogenase
LKTLAAVLEQPGQPFRIEELELLPPGPGEVLVRMAACGVCHSDWHLATGDTRHPLPVVPGHEGAGVIEAVGPGVSRVREGQPVTLSWAPDCGDCFYCRIGKPNLCDTYTGPLWAGTMLDGTPRLRRANGAPVYHYCGLAAFARHAVVPEPCCIPVDPAIPLRSAALVGCAVATGVGAAIETVKLRPGDRVAVLGCGGVGLNIVQGAALAGAGKIIAVDRFPGRLDAAARFGATDLIRADGDFTEAIRERTDGRGADVVFEAVGIPSLQEKGLEAVRPGGSLVLVGLSPMGTGTNFPASVIARQEKTVTGSYYGSVSPRRDFPRILDLYRGGRLKLDELVTRVWRLDEINEAFAAMLAGEGARGVIAFE